MTSRLLTKVTPLAFAISTIVWSGNAAYAQAVAATENSTDTAAAQQAPAAPAPAAGALDEVIVTGTRSSTRLQRAPVAIATVSAQKIAESGYVSPGDLQYIVPAVTFNPVVGAGFLIRGFGSQGFDYNLEKAVAVVVDDVVQGLPRSIGMNTLADIERVEVLKGPQGTLFGKNASAGVVFVVSRQPELNVSSVEGSIRYGTRNELQVDNTVNVPISNDVAARVTVVHQSRDGYLTNKWNGEKGGATADDMVRAKLLWKVTPSLTANFGVEYQKHEDTGANVIETVSTFSPPPGGVPPNSTTQIDFNNQLTGRYGIVFGPNNRDYAHNSATNIYIRQKGAQASLEYRNGGYTLTSVSAYKEQNSGNSSDADYTATDFFALNQSRLAAHQASQEFRINSPTGGFFDYVLGTYFFDQKVRATEAQGGSLSVTGSVPPIISPVGALANYTANSKSFATFGQSNVHLSDQFTAVLGGRYTHDKVGGSYYPSQDGIYQYTGTVVPAVAADASKTDVSGKATLQYTPTKDAMAYLTFAQGYKAPAVGTSRGVLRVVRPEQVDSWELGFKSQFLDRRVTFNASVFYQNFKDFQTTTAVFGADGVNRFVLDNAPEVLSKGVELELTAKATRDLTLSANLAYNPTEYQGFLTSCYGNQVVNPAPGRGCYRQGGANVYDVSGLPSIFSPKTTYNLGFDYKTMVSPTLQMLVNANYNHRSSVYSIAGNPLSIVPGYGLLGGSIGIRPMGGTFKVTLYGRNLTDKYFVVRNRALAFAGAGSYVQTPSSESGRTIGLRLDYALSN